MAKLNGKLNLVKKGQVIYEVINAVRIQKYISHGKYYSDKRSLEAYFININPYGVDCSFDLSIYANNKYPLYDNKEEAEDCLKRNRKELENKYKQDIIALIKDLYGELFYSTKVFKREIYENAIKYHENKQ